jgi:hypothetical protein
MYDTDSGSLSTALSNAGFSSSLIDEILTLTTGSPSGGGGGGVPGGGSSTVSVETVSAGTGAVVTVSAGTDVLFVHGSDTTNTNLTVPGNVPVIVFEGNGGVTVIINGGTGSGRVLVGSAGNDHITVADGTDTQIVLGTGHSTVTGGTGDDTIVAGHGNSTVAGGGGHDQVELGGTHSDYTITHGASSVSGGSQPQAGTTGHVIVTNSTTGVTTDITGLQYVQLAGTDALIFAESTVEAGVASLYHAAFGRTGEFGGVEYWFDQAKAGASLHDIAVAFTNSAEFAADAALTDAQFVAQLYQSTFGRTADAGGLTYWENALHSGASRADLLTAFASVAALNEAGTVHTEATIVGSVTIVTNIV